jgi:AcrR family transcriptional regulator
MATNLPTFELPSIVPDQDGRKQRSQSSRARIIQALLHLVGNGDYAPSAAQVAEQAGVGLRTVFRQFADMDSLYREMTDAIEAKVLPIMLEPLAGDGWKQRLFSAAERRAQVFEMVMPFRISANIKRFQSDYLMQDYQRMLALEKSIIEALLPGPVRADTVALHSINAVLSFQTWRLLRHDHDLPVAEARAVVQRLLGAALAQHPPA